MQSRIQQIIALQIATGFGIGRLRPAPGTWGSLAAVPLYIGLHAWLTPPLYVGAVLMGFLIGVWACGISEQTLKSRDSSLIVWDEIIGLLATMAWLPHNWRTIACGFVCFRLFDILKPPPIRHVDRRMQGGLGVMLDDLLAGIMANLATRLLLHLFEGAPL